MEEKKTIPVTPPVTAARRVFPVDGRDRALLETLLALEQTRSGAWTIAAGRCELCPRCARRDGLPCRNPGRMRYSFSAFGFDLAALARQELGIELLWVANGLPEYDVALAAFLER